MLGTLSVRLCSMTFWYPMLAELQYYTHTPLPQVVLAGAKGFTVEPPVDDGLRIRVPETVIVHYPYSREIGDAVDGEPVRGWHELCTAIDAAAEQVGGYPVFLRTEASSDKHSWKDTCYLTAAGDIGQHVYNLVEHAMMNDLPCDFFAVRRLIPTRAICTAFYGEMPIAKERRVFIRDGSVACHHPYWPADAFDADEITEHQVRELQELGTEDEQEITRLASYVAKYIDGAWSVDFLQDINGDWWCIDMAVADVSYHWPECPSLGVPRRIR